jgi:hypothetical protein
VSMAWKSIKEDGEGGTQKGEKLFVPEILYLGFVAKKTDTIVSVF